MWKKSSQQNKIAWNIAAAGKDEKPYYQKAKYTKSE